MKLSARKQLKVDHRGEEGRHYDPKCVGWPAKALASDDQKYSRRLTAGDNAKQVAAQLLRRHYNTTRTDPLMRVFLAAPSLCDLGHRNCCREVFSPVAVIPDQEGI